MSGETPGSKTMADEKFELTRRKALAGLGTIGAASAGAGLGTSAYFNDTESFTGNSVQAGELDLAVQATIYEYQGQANGEGQSFTRTVNGQQADVDVKQELTDVKPGDYSWGKFCFSIVDNPAYLWMNGELTANDENGVTEPEADDEDADDSSGRLTSDSIDNPNTTPTSDTLPDEGELADNVEVWIGYGTSSFDPTSQSRPSDGSPDGSIAQGTLADVLSQINGGLPLDSDGGTSGDQAFTGTSSQSFDDDRCVVFAWEVPTYIDNRIQTDSVEFDLDFTAVQERHNDGNANPY